MDLSFNTERHGEPYFVCVRVPACQEKEKRGEKENMRPSVAFVVSALSVCVLVLTAHGDNCVKVEEGLRKQCLCAK